MTTSHIAKRIGALEAGAGRTDHNLQIVIAQHGETREQALCRVGIERDAKDVLVVLFA